MKKLTLIGLLLIPFSTLGKEVKKIVFVGPALSYEQEFSKDSDLKVWNSVLRESRLINPPELRQFLGMQSYTVDVYVGSGGEMVAIDEYRFFPVEGDSQVYLYYVNVRGGWSTQVGSWYQVSNASEDSMMSLVAGGYWTPSE